MRSQKRLALQLSMALTMLRPQGATWTFSRRWWCPKPWPGAEIRSVGRRDLQPRITHSPVSCWCPGKKSREKQKPPPCCVSRLWLLSQKNSAAWVASVTGISLPTVLDSGSQRCRCRQVWFLLRRVFWLAGGHHLTLSSRGLCSSFS